MMEGGQNLKDVRLAVQGAQSRFRQRLEAAEQDGGLTRERYVRYLSMQYHLTKGVQRYFLLAAGSPATVRAPTLRRFLVKFAFEEEPHFQLALSDLRELGEEPLSKPLDVDLWHAYFDATIQERPFLRLGATCVLENISSGSEDVIDRLFSAASYLNKRNSVFFAVHRHGPDLPHGDQIMGALSTASLPEEAVADLVDGARNGGILYLRMADWALGTRRGGSGYEIPID